MITPPATAAERLLSDPRHYDADYYGWGTKAGTSSKSNYRRYGDPQWVKPLAKWLLARTYAPRLDVGAAFGHLVSALNSAGRRGHANAGLNVGAEWSAYATRLAVGTSPRMVRADGRALPFADASFETLISLDFVEHVEVLDLDALAAELVRVTKPGGVQLHLIGTPEHDVLHFGDRTHVAHLPLSAWRLVFIRAGLAEAPTLTEMLNDADGLHEWRGRWLAFKRPTT